MKLIVGLGNPGKKYEKTRHNTGFMLVDLLAGDEGLRWTFDKKFNAEVARGEGFLLVKPRTFMNKSGGCVSKLLNYFDIGLDDLILVHDDADLELGCVKFQKGRGAAGHKGVESVINALGTQDFWRLRVGIGRPDNENIDLEDWVLMDFSDDEWSKVLNDDVIREVSAVLVEPSQ